MTLPPVPHLIAWTLGAAGVVLLARLLIKEQARVNDELEALRAEALSGKGGRGHPTLRRDPHSGVYRPH